MRVLKYYVENEALFDVMKSFLLKTDLVNLQKHFECTFVNEDIVVAPHL